MQNSVGVEDRVNITVFLGAPGSGKGTQAKKLTTNDKIFHLSTGDILREEMRKGSEIGLKAKKFVDVGDLVPDDVMIEMLKLKLSTLPASAKVLLDGFPRTVKQAEALDHSQTTTVNQALYFEVPEDILVARLTGRRICPTCGESYHTEFVPPKMSGVCDKCSSQLIQRTDDGEGVVKHRLQVFHKQNTLLLSYYQDKKKLKRLDGNKEVNRLQDELISLLQ